MERPSGGSTGGLSKRWRMLLLGEHPQHVNDQTANPDTGRSLIKSAGQLRHWVDSRAV